MYRFQDLILALRKLGFRKTFDSRACGCRVRVFSKEDAAEDRAIDVQIFDDGEHRACSRFFGTYDRANKGCSDTIPTSFSDLFGMLRAIDVELSRMDSEYCSKNIERTRKEQAEGRRRA